MSRGLSTIILLLASNTFMTLVWYAHLRFSDISFFKHSGLFTVVLISWGIAFLEDCLMVPANRLRSALLGETF